MSKENHKHSSQPPQTQSHQPGIEAKMKPKPKAEQIEYKGSGKLAGKVAIITGGDSGIGRAVAIAFAKEGAKIAIGYLPEEEQDAQETKKLVEKEGQRCELMPGDISEEKVCKNLIKETINKFGKIDILINNAAIQYERESIEDIKADELHRLFAINFYSFIYTSKAALPHMQEGSTIINTTSVNPYKGNAKVLDYTCSKGAVVAFTRSLAQSLVDRKIRVNAVAPGPVWTPLIPASLHDPERVAKFGQDVPMKRPAQPAEIAPAYVFLASNDSSYFTGQVLHPNGGTIINT